MSNRKSYFANFPSTSLFVILKKSEEELEEINSKTNINDGLKTRKKELVLLINSIKSILVNRFINSNMTLREIAIKMINSDRSAKEVYKSLFMLRVIHKEELIDISLLEKAMDELDIDNILMIINSKKGTIYEQIANKKYDELIFQVDEEVYNDYLLKDETDTTIIEEELEKQVKIVESPFNIDDTITISRYVNNYLGISGDCSNLLHCGLKKFKSNYIMGVDNNFANSHPELVYKGYLLLVMDSNNKRGTYINPYYIDRLLEEDKTKEDLKSFYKHAEVDLSKIKEYIENFEVLLRQVQVNEELNQLIKDTHKVRKLKMLRMERK